MSDEAQRIDTEALLSKPVWTLDDLAAFLQLPKATLYKNRAEGKLVPGMRIGKHLRFKRDEVLEWLETKRDPV